MEILNNFGVQPILFVAQIINFLIIFWLLKKFMFKPVQTLLEKRKSTIEEGLNAAEENKRLVEETEKREKEVLRKAQSEARKLVEDAKTQYDTIIKKSKDDAKEEVETMLKDAKEQIAQEAKLTEKRLVTHVNALAAEMLKASVQDLFTDREQEAIIQTAAKKFKTS